MIDSSKPRRVRNRRAPLAALTVGFALVCLPSVAWAQGAFENYGDPSGPAAPNVETEASGAASGGSTGEAVPQEATPSDTSTDTSPDAVASEPSTTEESLPVTGLPAVPMALAGLVMMLLGTLGLRRFAGGSASSESGEGSPIDDAVVEKAIRPRGAVAVLEPITDDEHADDEAEVVVTAEPEPLASLERAPVVEDAVVAPDGSEAGLAKEPRADADIPTYAPVSARSRRATPGRVAGAALLVAGAVKAGRRISR